jgi:hypothetical protein
MSMLKIFCPSRASFEFVFWDMVYYRVFFGFLSDKCIDDGDAVGFGFHELFLELFLDLGELGRSTCPELSVKGECVQRARGAPMLGYAHALMFRDVEPFGLLLQYFADGAAFEAIPVLLSRGCFL